MRHENQVSGVTHMSSSRIVQQQERIAAPQPRPPFRADHVGSLLRPRDRWREARASAQARGTLSPPMRCGPVEDRCIRGGCPQAGGVGAAGCDRRRVPAGLLALRFRRRTATAWSCTQAGAEGACSRAASRCTFAARDEAGSAGARPVMVDQFQHCRRPRESARCRRMTIPAPSVVHFQGGGTRGRSTCEDLSGHGRVLRRSRRAPTTMRLQAFGAARSPLSAVGRGEHRVSVRSRSRSRG